MPDPIKVAINEQQIIKMLQRLAQVTNNLRPLMVNISEIMYDDVMENFQQQGQPRWQALSDITIIQRKRKGYWPGRILQMRGELAASIQAQADNSSARVSTNKVYAPIHHFGGQAGRGGKSTIPARPYMQLSSQALGDILSAIEDYLDAHLKGSECFAFMRNNCGA